jgi:CheY-like chemotaxis protein
MKDQITGRPRTVSGTAADAARVKMAPLAPTVLLADPDPGSRAMMRDALLEGTGPCQLRTVETARELEAYLRDPNPANPKPALVLIDLDLPRAGGVETLTMLKRDADLRHIPVVILASRPEPTSTAAAYEAGANTVIPKPATFIALVRLVKVLTAYWLDAAALPPQQELP